MVVYWQWKVWNEEFAGLYQLSFTSIKRHCRLKVGRALKPGRGSLRRRRDAACSTPVMRGWASVLIGGSGESGAIPRASASGPHVIVGFRELRKDGYDGWDGRPREKSRPRVLPPPGEEQTAFQRTPRPAPIRTQAMAGLLRAHLRHLHETMEVPTTAQVSETLIPHSLEAWRPGPGVTLDSNVSSTATREFQTPSSNLELKYLARPRAACTIQIS